MEKFHSFYKKIDNRKAFLPFNCKDFTANYSSVLQPQNFSTSNDLQYTVLDSHFTILQGYGHLAHNTTTLLPLYKVVHSYNLEVSIWGPCSMEHTKATSSILLNNWCSELEFLFLIPSYTLFAFRKLTCYSLYVIYLLLPYVFVAFLKSNFSSSASVTSIRNYIHMIIEL